MYIKTKYSDQLSVWEDTPENRKKAEQWGYEIYNGEIQIAYNGSVYIKGNAPEQPVKTYQDKRKEEYPQISEQLDMLYWDKVNGTQNWQNKIAEIKLKYPKE